MPPKNIRVVADTWGAGPGAGGTSFIEFKLNDETYDVFAGGTALDGREKLGEVKLSDGWRGRISFIVEDSPPYHEARSPDEIIVRGAQGVEARLMAAAWSGEAGAQFVSLVLGLDEAEIETLIRTQVDMSDAIDTVLFARTEIGSDDAQILDEIRNMLQCGNEDWDQLRERLTANADEAEVQRSLKLEATRLAREQSLLPFQDRIEQAVKAWAVSQSRDNLRIDVHKQKGVQEFLENFVLSHGKFPTGTVSIDYSYRGRYGAKFGSFFEVDLDSLK